MTGLAFNIMNLDSVSTSHPISVDVDNPDDINQIFDGITYGKVTHYGPFNSVYIK